VAGLYGITFMLEKEIQFLPLRSSKLNSNEFTGQNRGLE
jgi:hypothetical protein